MAEFDPPLYIVCRRSSFFLIILLPGKWTLCVHSSYMGTTNREKLIVFEDNMLELKVSPDEFFLVTSRNLSGYRGEYIVVRY